MSLRSSWVATKDRQCDDACQSCYKYQRIVAYEPFESRNVNGGSQRIKLTSLCKHLETRNVFQWETEV
jgi:hypothetical protein